jgi:hypothetical protein
LAAQLVDELPDSVMTAVVRDHRLSLVNEMLDGVDDVEIVLLCDWANGDIVSSTVVSAESLNSRTSLLEQVVADCESDIVEVISSTVHGEGCESVLSQKAEYL